MPQYKFSTRFPYVKRKVASVPPQRVIIPQGLISTSKTTIIEIPENLQNSPTVIAKAKIDDTFSDFTPITSSTFRNSYLFPKPEDASASLESADYSASTRSQASPTRTRKVVETREYIQEIPSQGYAPNIPPPRRNFDKSLSKSYPRAKGTHMPLMHEAGVTYGGMGYDYSPDMSGSFYQNYIEDSSTDLEEVEEAIPRATGSPYVNFEPLTGSTPKGYVQSAESYLNVFDYSVPAVYNRKVNQSSTTQLQRRNPAEVGIKQILDQLDQEESITIQRDLQDLQNARRRLIYDASKIKH